MEYTLFQDFACKIPRPAPPTNHPGPTQLGCTPEFDYRPLYYSENINCNNTTEPSNSAGKIYLQFPPNRWYSSTNIGQIAIHPFILDRYESIHAMAVSSVIRCDAMIATIAAIS